MSYTKFFKQSPNYTPGSQTRSVWGVDRQIREIQIHWWDDPSRGPTFEGVVSLLTNASRQASAHYVATAGRVAQLVREEDNAWATNSGNPYGISIECDPRFTASIYQTIAELVADIRRRRGNLPLVPHNRYANTRCPGTADLKKIEVMANDILNPPKPAPKPAPKPTPQITYKRLVSKKYETLKEADLWNFNTATWSGFTSVKKFSKGTEIEIVGQANHPLGSTYLMTAYSFGDADKTGVPKFPHGFNSVDLTPVIGITPPEPAETPKAPPEPAPNDPTPPSAAGKDRVGDLEKEVGALRSLLNQVVEWLEKIFKVIFRR